MQQLKHGIIVAGGRGSRMRSKTPKQYLMVGKLPVLLHTIGTFRTLEDVNIVVVLPKGDELFFRKLCDQYDFNHAKIKTTEGGEERFFSVKNGLNALEINNNNREHLVAIHDGARALVSKTTIQKSFDIARTKGSAIAISSMVSSLRQCVGETSEAVDRNEYKIVQTPQTFRYDWLMKAYEVPFSHLFTDDASVIEKAGFKVTIFEDSPYNIKITTPEDLLIARVIMNNENFSPVGN